MKVEMFKTKAWNGLLLIAIGASLIGSGCNASSGNQHSEVNTANKHLDPRVKSILSTMSIEDKVGEMTQLTIDMLMMGEPYNLIEPQKIDPAKARKALVDLKVGSILNVGGHTYSLEMWHKTISNIQKMAMEEKESGIPVLYGIDAIHGVNYTEGSTLFPQQIGQAATWDPALIKELAQISAYETRASGIAWNFSPVLDVGRDARWPRFWETYGEDVFLAQEMGKAAIEGYQGDNIGHPEHVAACLKHFLGYSVTLTGKDRTQAWIPERQLREYFLPSFKTGMNAGAATVMINSGEMNGIPVHCNPKILTDLLRNELSFEGLAVSDWEDIKYLMDRHRVAGSYKDAIKMAVNAGVDMSMVPTDLDFPVLLAELVREGEVPIEKIDQSVARIIDLKLKLGLFDHPYYPIENYPDFGSKKHRKKSLQAARESITLLKNEQNLLPLSKSLNILVTGPTAHSLNAMNGGWTHTWQGTETKFNPRDVPTVKEALEQKLSKDQVRFVEGSTYDEARNVEDAKTKAAQSDVIVVCLGEMPYTEKPGDLDNLTLPQIQIDLVKQLATTGKPMVLVLVEGRPRIISEIEPYFDGILMAYLPGNEGGTAISDVLFGEHNPSGKLPFTYPRHPASLLTYDHKRTDQVSRKFQFDAFDPQYEFGFGLSYTQFEYTNLELDTDVLEPGKTLSASVTVSNTGKLPGKEVVQCFTSDLVASITPSVKRLRSFEKISLQPGESQSVTFEITPEDLAFVGIDLQWVTEPGEFELMIGPLKSTFEFAPERVIAQK